MTIALPSGLVVLMAAVGWLAAGSSLILIVSKLTKRDGGETA